MAGYILVDIKTKKIVGICSIVTLFLFAAGVIIGYFSRSHTEDNKNQKAIAALLKTRPCAMQFKWKKSNDTVFRYLQRYIEQSDHKHVCVHDKATCQVHNLPRHYIAYHLNGKDINIDGKLDDEAWEEVPWTETFVDIHTVVYPAPRLETKVKIRWDNERLYIGAYIEETDLWATHKAHDSNIYTENGFEVLMDVDGTMFNYKQAQINVLGTMLDLMLNKSPYDNGTAQRDWHPDAQRAIYYEGTLNTPGDKDTFWSVEMAFTFTSLLEKSESKQDSPDNNDVWFMQFGRSEQKLNVTADNKYVKMPGSKTEWWSWQPCNAINLHLQDRWGLVQFTRSIDNKQFDFPKWHIYKSLFDTMNALKVYKALHGKYTTHPEELGLPPYLFSGACVEIPEIRLINSTDFEVTIRSLISDILPGHINKDRYVSFY